jgi:hypothetical protein
MAGARRRDRKRGDDSGTASFACNGRGNCLGAGRALALAFAACAVCAYGAERHGRNAGARAQPENRLGAILNELGDVVADAGLYLPLGVVPGFNAWLVAGVVLLAVFSEMTGVIGVQIGGSRRYDGPFGKSDRAFVFGLLGLLLGLHVAIEPAIPYALAAMMLLLALTIINRARRALLEVARNAARK